MEEEAQETRLHGQPIPAKWQSPHRQQENNQETPNRSSIQQPAKLADLGEDGRSEIFLMFNEQSIRKAFIRKVYAILMAQLMVTMAFIAWFTFHEPTIEWVQEHIFQLLIPTTIVVVTTILLMACCSEIRRQAPMNFIFLFIFTAAMSFILGILASTCRATEVLVAVGITAGICLALTLFAFQTKWDFTMLGGSLIVILTVFVLFGITAIFIPKTNLMRLLYAGIGVLIFSLYMVYDTQLILGGKHKYAHSPEEYIFAALNLYLDIINILIRILMILRR